jgi:hypothetical protein
MRARHALPATIALALVALTGCSDDPSRAGAAASPSAGDSASEQSTSSPTGTPTGSTPSSSPSSADNPSDDASGTSTDVPSRLPTSRIQAVNLHVAVLGRNAARTPEEKAVVRAWMAFWQGTADTYYFYKPTAQFDAVARGTARSGVLDYLAKVKARKQRVVGWARDNVTSVQVTGNRATVRDCTKNFTFTVDDEAEPMTRPDDYYDVTGTLRKTGGRWTVVAQTSDPQETTCLS